MAHAGQSSFFLKTKIPSKESVLSSEKENVATTSKKKLSISRESRESRFVLSSNEERRKGAALKNEDSRVSRVSRELERNARAKKTPFHVHFDDKNIAARSSAAPRTNTSSKRILCRLKIESKVASSCGGNDAKQVNETTDRPVRRLELRKIEISSAVFGKKHSVEEPRINKQLPPSRIPRRRSRSAQSVQTVARDASKRSSSVDQRDKNFAIGSVNKRATLNRPVSKTVENINVTLGTRNKVNDKRRKISTGSPNIAREKEKSLTIKTATPNDRSLLPPLPTTPIKVVIRRSKYNASASDKGELSEPRNDFKEEVDLFPAELLYHGEYHDDLPMIEREREQRAPQLSGNFLTKHINAEQRRLVVVFMIRLGIHCRYPSRIVYQSVKLFDAVMDKISVDTMLIQLNALASLWIVLKRQEKFHKIPSATRMVSLANDLYVGREDLLIDYERKILEVLNFNITFADAFSLFTHHLISCQRYINVSEETGTFLYNCGCYMIDITLLDEQFCKTSAGLISVTVLELVLGLSLDVTRDNAVPRWLFWRGLLSAVLSLPQRFEDKAIDSLRVAILRRVLDSQIKQDSFNVLYKKYTRSRYGRVSKPLLEQVSRISVAETIFDP